MARGAIDPARALLVACDVGDAGQARAAVERALARFGRVDVLVNNAAVLHHAPVVGTSADVWDETLAAGLSGAFYLVRAVLPGMRERGFGRIVNVTSGWSCDGAPGYAAYAAAKAGLDSLTRSLAGELGRGEDVLVNGFNPGTMQTPMWPHEGRAPEEVAPYLLRLATLPVGGFSGRIVATHERW
jgi:3-oxoacyl-[acyl-carrier protein] reductase